jgi:hypothetical protein
MAPATAGAVFIWSRPSAAAPPPARAQKGQLEGPPYLTGVGPSVVSPQFLSLSWAQDSSAYSVCHDGQRGRRRSPPSYALLLRIFLHATSRADIGSQADFALFSRGRQRRCGAQRGHPRALPIHA